VHVNSCKNAELYVTTWPKACHVSIKRGHGTITRVRWQVQLTNTNEFESAAKPARYSTKWRRAAYEHMYTSHCL